MRSHPRATPFLLVVAAAGALLSVTPPAARAAAPRAAHPATGPGVSCRVARQGSTVVADCHNPDPGVALLQLHITCARWWDPATDSAPVPVGPAQWATLTGRCWKEIRAARVSRG